MNKDQVHFTTKPSNRDDTVDIAIIGAGIAGSYAAWRLRHANVKITLYEYSDRIGGRCHTVQFPDAPDIYMELGAMRFNPSDHLLLNAAISELGLETIDFLPENADSMYYLRGQHVSGKELPDLAPYELKPEHRKQPTQLNCHIAAMDSLNSSHQYYHNILSEQPAAHPMSIEHLQVQTLREIFQNFTNVDKSQEGYRNVQNILKYTTPDGIPLYQQSHESLFGKFLYPEMGFYLQDTSGSVSVYQDVSASKSIPVKDPNFPTNNTPYKTVVGGLQTVPETMVQQFLDSSEKHAFQPNLHLKLVSNQHDGLYTLTFQPTQTKGGRTNELTCASKKILAKAVFLAIPRLALEQLEWSVLKEPTIVNYIKNSLYEAYATKIYFSYDNPWWRTAEKTAPTMYSTTPLRLTTDFGVSKMSGEAVLNASFTDLNTAIWKNANTQGEPVLGVGDGTIQMTDIAQNMTTKFLAEIYGMAEENIPRPNYSAMRIWDEYPYGASWYYFRPGYIWTEVADQMLKPSKDDEVFIISNVFSGTCQQAWMEGALEIVDNMIRKYVQNSL